MSTDADTSVKDQLGEMFDDITDDNNSTDDATVGGNETDGGEKTVVDGDKGDSPAAPVTDKVVDDDVVDSTKVPVTETNPEGVKLTVVDDIDDLRKRIADMSMPATTTPVPVEDDAVLNPLDVFKENIDYITAENLPGIADNPLLLNNAMNNVRRQTAEGILNIVPILINNAMQAQTVKTEMHNTFYGAHPELAPYKAYVAVVAKDVQEQMKDKTQEEILAAVAQSVKASLQLKTVVPAVEKKVGDKPALRDGKGGGRKAGKTVDPDSLEAQISEMLT